MDTPSLQERKKCTGLLTSLYRCFYTRAIYLEVYQVWHYRIFTLLLLLAMIVCLTDFIRPLNSIQAFRHDSHKIATQLPTLTFKQYLLSIDRPSPYSIKTSTNGSLLMVFDTHADAATLAAYQPMLFTFGAQGFYIHNLNQSNHKQALNFKPYNQYHLINLDHLVLTPKESMRYLSALIIFAQLCLYGLSVIAIFTEYLFVASFLGLAAMVIAITHKIHISKSGAFRIGALAMVPAMTWLFIFDLFAKANSPWLTFTAFSIAFGYCHFAIKTLKKNLPPMQDPS